jgi:hypothetical protein
MPERQAAAIRNGANRPGIGVKRSSVIKALRFLTRARAGAG